MKTSATVTNLAYWPSYWRKNLSLPYDLYRLWDSDFRLPFYLRFKYIIILLNNNVIFLYIIWSEKYQFCKWFSDRQTDDRRLCLPEYHLQNCYFSLHKLCLLVAGYCTETVSRRRLCGEVSVIVSDVIDLALLVDEQRLRSRRVEEFDRVDSDGAECTIGVTQASRLKLCLGKTKANKTRKPTNWWGNATRDVTHPTVTRVYNICYHLFRKRSCLTVHRLAWASWPRQQDDTSHLCNA